jgi:hypothetical protein
MNRDRLSTGSALAGVAVLAACACGAGSGIVNAVNAAGMQTPDTVIFGASCGTDHSVQPLFVGAGALLVIFGMSLRKLSAAILAAVGCLAFAYGSLTAGPSTMSLASLLHTDRLGYAAYIVAAVFLVAAFLRAFPSPRPLAAGTAMAGMALATGCSCCMITGAVTALLASAGMTWVYTTPYTVPPVFFAGAALAAAGLWRLGGPRPAALAVSGSLINFGGTRLTSWALPQLMIYGADFRFVPSYALYLLGTLTMLSGFVVAYRVAARRFAVEPAAHVLTEPATAVGR